MMRRSRLLLGLALLALAACGGGGGGPDPDPHPDPPTEYDRQAGLAVLNAAAMYQRGGTGTVCCAARIRILNIATGS